MYYLTKSGTLKFLANVRQRIEVALYHLKGCKAARPQRHSGKQGIRCNNTGFRLLYCQDL